LHTSAREEAERKKVEKTARLTASAEQAAVLVEVDWSALVECLRCGLVRIG